MTAGWPTAGTVNRGQHTFSGMTPLADPFWSFSLDCSGSTKDRVGTGAHTRERDSEGERGKGGTLVLYIYENASIRNYYPLPTSTSK